MMPEYVISPAEMGRLVESGEIVFLANEIIEAAKAMPAKLRPATRNTVMVLADAINLVTKRTGRLSLHLVAACLLAAYWQGVQTASRQVPVFYVAEPSAGAGQ